MTKRLLLAALVLSGFAYADGGCVHDMALQQRATGLAVIPGAQVRVCTDTACNSLATIYSDSTLGTSAANPITADTKGNYSFCASGTYTVKVTNPADGTSYFQTNVTASPVAGTATKVATNDKGFVNVVTDCGANNAGVVDTSAAITACYTANPTRNIFWPYGTYNMGSTSVTPSGSNQVTECENTQTLIKFAAGTPGFIFDSSKGADMKLMNCTLQGAEAWTPATLSTYVMPSGYGGTSAADGIRVFTAWVVIENVHIFAFGRHGIYTTNTAFGGNADHWYYKNVRVAGVRGHGFYYDGNDSQVGTCINCDSRGNQGWGIWDNSGLGNVFISPHTSQDGLDNTLPTSTVNVATTAQDGWTVTVTTATAHGASVGSWIWVTGTSRITGLNINHLRVTSVPNSTTLVTRLLTQWGGNVGATVASGADTGTLGVTPGGEVWRLASFDGGPYKNTSGVSPSVWVGPYAEFGQPPSKWNNKQTIIGGTIGSDVDYSLKPRIWNDQLEGFFITPHRLDGSNFSTPLLMDFGRQRAGLQDTSPCFFRLIGSSDSFGNHLCMTANQQYPHWFGYRINEQHGTASDDLSVYYAQMSSDNNESTDPARTWFPNGFLIGRQELTFKRRFTVSAAQPSACAYVGEVAYASDPGATGFVGWICRATGTPGTWLAIPMGAVPVTATSQTASIATTTLYTPSAASMWQVCYDLKVIQAATTSSSIAFTVGWNNGSAKTKSSTAVTTNTLNDEDGGCYVISSNASQAITYATTYASSGATAMQYQVKVSATQLQ